MTSRGKVLLKMALPMSSKDEEKENVAKKNNISQVKKIFIFYK